MSLGQLFILVGTTLVPVLDTDVEAYTYRFTDINAPNTDIFKYK